MIHVLALVATVISTAALTVLLSLTALVLSLAFRAQRPSGSRKGTTRL